jgi:AraC family transcriptional regulator
VGVANVSLLLETPLLKLGEFVCPPGDDAWRETNVIGDRPHVVFPRVPVVIQHDGAAPVLATPTHTMLYNADQAYRRELRNPAGDDCVFVELSEESLGQLAGDGVELFDGERLVASHAPAARETYFLQHLLVRHLRSPSADPLLAEEAAVAATIAALRPPRVRSSRAHHELAEAAKAELAADSRLSLHQLARRLHASAFHLARVFRAETGFTVHGFRQSLRLRAALERLSEHSDDLTVLALELGFSSHSHFTERFRNEFGVPPSRIRDEREVRGLLQAAVRRLRSSKPSR